LVELVIVLGVVSVLAALAVHTAGTVRQRSLARRADAELAVITLGLESYRHHFGDYPMTSDPMALRQALEGHRSPSGWLIQVAPFIPISFLASDGSAIRDPWGWPLVYRYSPASESRTSSYLLYSCGPDGDHQWGEDTDAHDTAHPLNRDNRYPTR
jgi:type II secretory pathway pseudopilin PulG